jgi:hypothetical protein
MIYPTNFIGEAVLGAWKALADSPTMTAFRKSRRLAADTEDDQPGNVGLPTRYIFPKCGRAGTWQDSGGDSKWIRISEL